MMKQLFESSQLFGSNAPFIEELYENYLDNPDSVSDEWRGYFDSLQNTPGSGRDVAHYPIINAFAEMAKRGPVRTVLASGGGVSFHTFSMTAASIGPAIKQNQR